MLGETMGQTMSSWQPDSVRRRSALSYINRCFWALWLSFFLPIATQSFAQTKNPNEKDIDASIQLYENQKINFSIPSNLKPEVYDSFFRIYVDYPSMTATTGPRGGRLNVNTLEIKVYPYPKNGTRADAVINGVYGSRRVGYENGYSIYDEPVGKTDHITTLGFQDPSENNVIIEILGSWSVRNVISHGVRPNYRIECAVNKNLHADFRVVDAAVSRLIASMFAGASPGNR
jgi:hypothetical protein